MKKLILTAVVEIIFSYSHSDKGSVEKLKELAAAAAIYFPWMLIIWNVPICECCTSVPGGGCISAQNTATQSWC